MNGNNQFLRDKTTLQNVHDKIITLQENSYADFIPLFTEQNGSIF
jgi:hypothetical protein